MEADGFRCNDMHQRSALNAGEHLSVNVGSKLFFTEDHAAARSAQGFVRCGGHKVGMRHRVGMATSGNETRDVCHIHHQISADAVGNLSQLLEVDDPRIGAGPGHDHFRLIFISEPLEVFVVDLLRFLIHTVRDDLEETSGKVHRVPMRQVAAFGEAHGENGVAGVEHGKVNGHIGTASAVRLHIHMLCTEELFGAIDGEALGFIDPFAAVVPALGRIAFSIFVGQARSLCFAYSSADNIF